MEIEIRKLENLSYNPTLEWGLNGYVTNKIYSVSTIEAENIFEFAIREKKQHYSKVWETNENDIENFNKIIAQGNSFGACYENKLIGWIICEFRPWNNSFYIENILVSEAFRGQNIGRMFIKHINRKATELQCRIVELETQNTNYPAIQFYKKAGFKITGINTKLYNDSMETALYMSFDVF